MNYALLGYNAASSGNSLPTSGEPRITQLALRLLFTQHASVSLQVPVDSAVFTACLEIIAFTLQGQLYNCRISTVRSI